MRLLTGPGGVAEPTNWANTPARTLRADAVPATHCIGIGSDWGLLQQIAAYEASRTGGDILSIYTTPSTRRKRNGNAVIKKTVLCAVDIGASAVLTSSAVAQANPATPIPVIESSAAQLCGAINGNPTEDGVIAGMNSLENRGLDEMDGALVLITAIHHVCPQHEALMMGIMGPIAAEEICSKPS